MQFIHILLDGSVCVLRGGGGYKCPHDSEQTKHIISRIPCYISYNQHWVDSPVRLSQMEYTIRPDLPKGNMI